MPDLGFPVGIYGLDIAVNKMVSQVIDNFLIFSNKDIC